MARRRAKPGSGSLPSALREGPSSYGRGTPLPNLGDVRYVLVGGLATARYMPERMTLDTDILIKADALAETEEALRAAGCRRTASLTIGGSTWRMPGGRSLDVLALDQPWVGYAIDTAITDREGVPCIGLPYLVIMKLTSSRLQDLADISRMLGEAEEAQLTTVRTEVGQYRPQDLEDLERMIQLGKLEHDG